MTADLNAVARRPEAAWHRRRKAPAPRPPSGPAKSPEPRGEAGRLEAAEVSAWFGDHLVLDDVSLSMPAATVTALIGPSGCGKSTFLRILNRMHEATPGAKLAGEVHLNGEDIYASGHRLTDVRKQIGMVFQKPNPFPAMSIADNVTAGLALTGTKVSKGDRHELVEVSLTKAGLWNEVKDRFGRPGARSRAVSSSGCASPGPWPSGRRSCSWTSPARPSTRPRPAGSKRPSPRSAPR